MVRNVSDPSTSSPSTDRSKISKARRRKTKKEKSDSSWERPDLQMQAPDDQYPDPQDGCASSKPATSGKTSTDPQQGPAQEQDGGPEMFDVSTPRGVQTVSWPCKDSRWPQHSPYRQVFMRYVNSDSDAIIRNNFNFYTSEESCITVTNVDEHIFAPANVRVNPEMLGDYGWQLAYAFDTQIDGFDSIDCIFMNVESTDSFGQMNLPIRMFAYWIDTDPYWTGLGRPAEWTVPRDTKTSFSSDGNAARERFFERMLRTGGPKYHAADDASEDDSVFIPGLNQVPLPIPGSDARHPGPHEKAYKILHLMDDHGNLVPVSVPDADVQSVSAKPGLGHHSIGAGHLYGNVTDGLPYQRRATPAARQSEMFKRMGGLAHNLGQTAHSNQITNGAFTPAAVPPGQHLDASMRSASMHDHRVGIAQINTPLVGRNLFNAPGPRRLGTIDESTDGFESHHSHAPTDGVASLDINGNVQQGRGNEHNDALPTQSFGGGKGKGAPGGKSRGKGRLGPSRWPNAVPNLPHNARVSVHMESDTTIKEGVDHLAHRRAQDDLKFKLSLYKDPVAWKAPITSSICQREEYIMTYERAVLNSLRQVHRNENDPYADGANYFSIGARLYVNNQRIARASAIPSSPMRLMHPAWIKGIYPIEVMSRLRSSLQAHGNSKALTQVNQVLRFQNDEQRTMGFIPHECPYSFLVIYLAYLHLEELPATTTDVTKELQAFRMAHTKNTSVVSALHEFMTNVKSVYAWRPDKITSFLQETCVVLRDDLLAFTKNAPSLQAAMIQLSNNFVLDMPDLEYQHLIDYLAAVTAKLHSVPDQLKSLSDFGASNSKYVATKTRCVESYWGSCGGCKFSHNSDAAPARNLQTLASKVSKGREYPNELKRDLRIINSSTSANLSMLSDYFLSGDHTLAAVPSIDAVAPGIPYTDYMEYATPPSTPVTNAARANHTSTPAEAPFSVACPAFISTVTLQEAIDQADICHVAIAKVNDNKNTRLCSWWQGPGFCPYQMSGNGCRFNHDPADRATLLNTYCGPLDRCQQKGFCPKKHTMEERTIPNFGATGNPIANNRIAVAISKRAIVDRFINETTTAGDLPSMQITRALSINKPTGFDHILMDGGANGVCLSVNDKRVSLATDEPMALVMADGDVCSTCRVGVAYVPFVIRADTDRTHSRSSPPPTTAWQQVPACILPGSCDYILPQAWCLNFLHLGEHDRALCRHDEDALQPDHDNEDVKTVAMVNDKRLPYIKNTEVFSIRCPSGADVTYLSNVLPWSPDWVPPSPPQIEINEDSAIASIFRPGRSQ